MPRLRTAVRELLGSDEGQSLVVLAAKLVAAFVVGSLVLVAYTRLVDGGHVPLEQCIEHQSCEAAAQAHGY